ncbi:MAG: DUF2961 domain-containing protein, partial [Acidobacteriota bacterium]
MPSRAPLRRTVWTAAVAFLAVVAVAAPQAPILDIPPPSEDDSAGENVYRPWRILDDPRELPRVDTEHGRTLLRSSHCPSGCGHDRHSASDSRFLRMDGGEGVLFEDFGPGVVTRIWMTTGDGVSRPLPEEARIRMFLDGDPQPVLDLPLPELFAGTEAPFEGPLVQHRLQASGGNFSVVPIPYRDGCRITVEGLGETLLWFQIHYTELASAEGVATFSGDEDLSRWRRLLASPPGDPWAEAGRPVDRHGGQGTLIPEQEVTLLDLSGSALVTELRLRLPDEYWSRTFLRLELDGRETVYARLVDVFGTGKANPDDGLPRSLLLGFEDGAEELYAYLPLAYFERLRLSLESRLPSAADFEWRARVDPGPPHPDSGLLTVQGHDARSTEPGKGLPLLRLPGAGKWVGLFAELGASMEGDRLYLEGDERIWLDGERHPALYGTGVEDFFAGGFYFDRGRFDHPLAGMVYQGPTPEGDLTAAFRWMLGDAVVFRRGIRAEMETGPDGRLPMRARTL